jgi:glycosyltransferase involved in cell wall biosynthesis
MMHIGLITGEYPPDRGGVGDFTEQLARALADLGHRLHIMTSSSQISEQVDGPAGVTVHRAVENWRFGCWGQVLSLSKDLKLDIINVQYQAAAYDMHPAINLVPRRQGRPPVVVTFHDLKVPYLFPKAGPLRWWMVRTLACRADGVVVTNREDELKLSDLQSRISNLTRIPIGSNIPSAPPSGYDREAERARWGIEHDDLLLGYFGFLNESKGGEELIEALALLVEEGAPAHLLKIGGRAGTSDPTNRAYADRVDALIEALGLEERVHWTGFVRPKQVAASLYATDVCVLPYRDGVSFRRGSLLACLAHGRAIVTTRPAVRLLEIQDGETMLLVEPNSPSALAGAVNRLASDPTLRTRLEAGAETLAAQFGWGRIAQRTAGFFARVISGSR